MAIGGIGGQSSFYPAQAAAQYTKNAASGIDDIGKMGQARKDAAAATAEKSTPLGGQPPGGMAASGSAADGGRQKSAAVGESPAKDESSANSAVYDPRDTNRDGKVSLQEELAYAAKQYSARSTGIVNATKIPPPNGVTGQEPQSSSISLKV